MAIDDVVGKREALKTIVGRESYTGSPIDNQHLEIRPEDVDKVCLIIKKCRDVITIIKKVLLRGIILRHFPILKRHIFQRIWMHFKELSEG